MTVVERFERWWIRKFVVVSPVFLFQL
uniref:Uncharacterized protein n=1 Tax=Arundo donax TaxID=35708 RepID=A0A0A8Y2V3_ARUDO